MPISKAQQQSIARYCKRHYDTITLRLPKGYKKQLQDLATSQGISVNALIKRAIDSQLDTRP